MAGKKELTVEEQILSLQNQIKKYEDRLEEFEALASTNKKHDGDVDVDSGDDSEDDEDAGFKSLSLDQKPNGLDSFYRDPNLVPDVIRVAKFLDKRIKRSEDQRRKEEYSKELQHKEEAAKDWLRKRPDYSKELERDILRDIKARELRGGNLTKIVQQAYQNVTGVKLDYYGNEIKPNGSDSTTIKDDVNAKTSKENDSSWNIQKITSLSDTEFEKASKDGTLRDNWAAIGGAKA